ncbi:hypothetical protein N8I84_02850 [Streptomyces cynarae]|uniref:Uncharacterized protein n=1 Tax=Streptomyces cynarae TaxID=2981134 RepID=A0ABY6DTT8_9ACTN|nr:hypothetical protein [Streptomyces cynarae]UXY17791.1 hypothetical protein N8I84_02850 [Streptomyces cynarae]
MAACAGTIIATSTDSYRLVKHNKALATRYDKHARQYQAMIRP